MLLRARPTPIPCCPRTSPPPPGLPRVFLLTFTLITRAVVPLAPLALLVRAREVPFHLLPSTSLPACPRRPSPDCQARRPCRPADFHKVYLVSLGTNTPSTAHTRASHHANTTRAPTAPPGQSGGRGGGGPPPPFPPGPNNLPPPGGLPFPPPAGMPFPPPGAPGAPPFPPFPGMPGAPPPGGFPGGPTPPGAGGFAPPPGQPGR